MKVVSFFSGCGGLDLGFENVGFNVVWANEYDQTICPTYLYNHPKVILSSKSICNITPKEIPECDGFIGGPPCQAWSEGGKGLGLKDERGRVFLEYIRLIKAKRPKFFLIENVPGILTEKHRISFERFILELESADYKISHKVLNAKNYGIPQDRERVFVIGIRNDMDITYEFPKGLSDRIITLKDAIGDIAIPPREYKDGIVLQDNKEIIPNHDVYIGPFDEKFMSRNRVRKWHEPSFTIQALAKNAPIHPQAPTMVYVNPNKRVFKKGYEHLYRRLSVRECARIQSFPDTFKFIYSNVKDGYKMVGNAVPPKLGFVMAQSIVKAFSQKTKNNHILIGYYKGQNHLNLILSKGIYYFPIIRLDNVCPSYLLLHNNGNRYLFTLKDKDVTKVSASFLKSLGFHPQRENYYIVNLDKEIFSENPIALNILKGCTPYLNSYSPVIVNF
ncbi:MAG: DNA cytosine methyltransferase [Paludibacteraceae bacterium]|nr:DNA cytosine methyltransferase [Paludibacteraceae bacterium]